MDDFNSLWNRLLNRAPMIGPELAQQFVNDSWQTLQSRKEWSFRRRSGTFAPPDLYLTGSVSTNAAVGNPLIVTGLNTAWTPDMIGRQIRIGGLLYPYYTIAGWLSPTSLMLDQPWAGADVVNQPYNILQIYYPVPSDWGYFYVAVSIKDGYRLFTETTQYELAMLDPQRSNQGQTYGVAFRDYTSQLNGVVGPVIPVTSPSDPSPISTTSTGFTYPANATYIVQVVLGGISGVATFQWLRAGQTAFVATQLTSDLPIDLSDGVQIYWPDTVVYVANDIFVINCQAMATEVVPRVELWPGPTFSGYLYPYLYVAKEYALTQQQPQLPPFVANRGEVLLEMALQKCAEFPGQDMDHRNVYYDLRLAQLHAAKVQDLLIDFEANDQNVDVTNLQYMNWPFAGPWGDGSWQQRHAPFLNAAY